LLYIIDPAVELEHWLARTRHDSIDQDVFWNTSVLEIMSISMKRWGDSSQAQSAR
jgi:hypothetical protein